VPDTPQPAPRDTAKDPGSVVEFPGTPEGGRQPNNLPLELSSFVGREREIAEVEGLLLSGRQLLTLCGPGGAGKTRLALAVASRLGDHFEDGVWWVELASISDPDLVAQAVAQTLMIADESGRPLADILARDLAATELLLVLDNCEHLIEACAELADALLKACPDLHILATSREPLRIAGEASWSVPVFPCPILEVCLLLRSLRTSRLYVSSSSGREKPIRVLR
jgi:predicted ATPase